jgi:hypothetical protein
MSRRRYATDLPGLVSGQLRLRQRFH